jgi:hypothetical protein
LKMTCPHGRGGDCSAIADSLSCARLRSLDSFILRVRVIARLRTLRDCALLIALFYVYMSLRDCAIAHSS